MFLCYFPCRCATTFLYLVAKLIPIAMDCCVSLNVNNVLRWHGYIVILLLVDRALSVIATLYNVITVRFTLQIHLPLTNGLWI
jgi:hypothetical protein